MFVRTTKSEGQIRLRFRIREGRSADFYYTSDISADLQSLSKLDEFGNKKAKVSIYDEELSKKIKERIELIEASYNEMKAKGISITADLLKRTIDKTNTPSIEEEHQLLALLQKRNEANAERKVYSISRTKLFKVLHSELERFLKMNGAEEMEAKDFSGEHLLDFQSFLRDEYKKVSKYKGLYKDMAARNIPTQPRNQNTIAARLRLLRTFFNELVAVGEIDKSPFDKLIGSRKKSLLAERYDAPVALTSEEFQKVLNAELPQSLREAQQAFLVQCALGCRLGDFQGLTMDNLRRTEAGTPYIHYQPQKTRNKSNDEVITPLVRFAFDIIKASGFDFKVVKYASGERGYSAKIKKVLEECGIDRKVEISDPALTYKKEVPLYSVASSKLARKTHVSMTAKVQLNPWASGLHRIGSEAVNHYTALNIEDKFRLLNAAFNQPSFAVDEAYNVTSVRNAAQELLNGLSAEQIEAIKALLINNK